MKNVGYIFLLFSLNLFAAGISVNERVLKDSVNGTKLLYVNGQENEEVDAIKAVNHLDQMFKFNEGLDTVIDINSNVEIDYVFNRTFGKNADGLALADFMESAVLLLLDQFESMSVGEAWGRVYATAYNLRFFVDGNLTTSNKEAFDAFDLVGGFLEFYTSTSEIVGDLQSEIISNLAADKNLIIISHSQGNLFTNVAYQGLVRDNVEIVDGETIRDFENRIGNLQVATPASSIEIRRAEYITNNHDAILKLNQFGLNTTLPANFAFIQPGEPDPREESDSVNNHGFVSTYLSGFETGNLVLLRDTLFQKLVDISSQLGEELVLCEHGILNSLGEFIPDNSGSCLEFDSTGFGESSVLVASTDRCPYQPVNGFSSVLQMFNIFGNESSDSVSGQSINNTISVTVSNSVPDDGRFVFFDYMFEIYRETEEEFPVRVDLYEETGALRCIAQQDNN